MSLANSLRQSNSWKTLTENEKLDLKLQAVMAALIVVQNVPNAIAQDVVAQDAVVAINA